MKIKAIFCFILILFSIPLVSFSQEKVTEEPMSLFDIDKLIKKTEYEEALKQLNIYLDVYPEQFDNVQSRISKIMNARINYSELATTLIDIIRNDPTNNKRIYEITAQLENFEKHPSDENLQFISDVKKSAEFNYFRSTFLEIQTAMAEFVKINDMANVVTTAQSGFWLYKDAFYEQWEDMPEIINSVNKIVEDLNRHLDVFKDPLFVQNVYNAIQIFVKAVNEDRFDDAIASYVAVESELDKYYKAGSALINDNKKLEQLMEKLRPLDSSITEASFLSFLSHFMTGVDNIVNSGVFTGVRKLWSGFNETLNIPVFAKVKSKYDLYVKNFDAISLDSLKKYISLESTVYGATNRPYETKEMLVENPFDSYIVLSTYLDDLTDAYIKDSTVLSLVNNNQEDQNDVITKLMNVDKVNIDKYSHIQNLLVYSKNLDELTGKKEDAIKEYETWSKPYIDGSFNDFVYLTDEYLAVIDQIYDTKEVIINKAWDNITYFYKTEGERVYKVLEEYCNAVNEYTSGFFIKIPQNVLEEIHKDIKKSVAYKSTFNPPKETIKKAAQDLGLDENSEGLGVYYKYPDIALEVLGYLNSNIEKGIYAVNEYKDSIIKDYNSDEQWKVNDSVSQKVEEVKKFLDEQIALIESLRIKVKPYAEQAKSQTVAAAVAQNEADLRYINAEAELNKENFDKARKNLQNAKIKYQESLNNQNNEILRAQWDEKLLALEKEIANRENQIVVREVRVLKDKAKDAYFNGRFDDADMYLNQASIRWSLTNSTEDPEIENLRNFVDTAISMKTGREILPSAPQYPEMSQLMNIAHTYYDEGSSLLKKGSKDEAFENFDMALESIQKIQYVYPLNQEAAILTLEINRLQDPEKFREEFANRIENAKALCNNKDTQQEGYANLLDYYKLDPKYPGLKKLIYDIEIQIGIRQKPVDNSGRIKGEKYLKEAQKLFKTAGGDFDKLNVALDRVNKAISYLPDNNEAKDLKDEINIKIGSTTVTLTVDEEQSYDLAVKRFQDNNMVGAKAIVDRLLKNPKNTKVKKVMDLKNKIEARIGR